MYLSRVYRWITCFGWTFLLSLVICSTGFSATYFVDYENGNDNNAGLTQGSPWKHCPGDINAQGNADIIFSPGDTVVFKGGSVYEFTNGINDYIAANASGTSGNIITYISGHVHQSSWGTNRAKFDCTYAKPSAASKKAVFHLGNYQYITIQGLEMTALAENSSFTAFIAWEDSNNSTDAQLLIDDVLLYKSNANGIIITGRYTSGTRASNVTIKNSTIYDTYAGGIGIRWGMSDVLIENNHIDQAGSDPYGEGGALANPIGLAFGDKNGQLDITIRGNDIGDSTGTDNKGLILVQNSIENLTIEDNYFYGIPKLGSPHFVGPVTNLIIRNNVFHIQPTNYEGILRFYSDQAVAASDGIHIYNNTFVCETAAASGIIFFKAGSDHDVQYKNVDIRNNTIDTDTETGEHFIYIGNTIDGSNIPVVELSSFTVDYNAYQSLRVDGRYFYVQDDGRGRTFAQWKAWLSNGGASGADAHSVLGQVTFVDETGGNFRIVAGDEVAKDKGIDLSSKGFSDDKDSLSRPQGSQWDIGAYEEAIPAPSAPKNLRVTD